MLHPPLYRVPFQAQLEASGDYKTQHSNAILVAPRHSTTVAVYPPHLLPGSSAGHDPSRSARYLPGLFLFPYAANVPSEYSRSGADPCSAPGVHRYRRRLQPSVFLVQRGQSVPRSHLSGLVQRKCPVPQYQESRDLRCAVYSSRCFALSCSIPTT